MIRVPVTVRSQECNNMSSRPARQEGFTLVELLFAMSLFVVMSAATVMVTSASLPGIRVDGQARRLMALMQRGRDLAVANRRDVHLRFDTAEHTATIVLMDAGVEKPVETVYLEYHVQFRQFPGLGDTPEEFGAQEVVDFGDAANIIFEPDGSAIDETGTPTNGTVFLGIEGHVEAARAITLMGTTARPRLYRYSKTGGANGWWSPQ
jgi:prepilin-type N-terminal cleavage/methylation domain-containing protein